MNNEQRVPRFVRAFARHKLGIVGMVVLALFFIVSFLGPVVIPIDPYVMDLENAFSPPGQDGHLLGTDNFGRDVLARLIYGARISLLIGFVVVSISGVIGTVLGLVSGYFGRWVDYIIMRLVEVFYSFPFLVLVIAVMAILGPSIYSVMGVLGLVSWPKYARVVRSLVLSLRETEYIQAARTIGTSHRRIIFRHILPHTITPVIIQATLSIPEAILAAASLGFLGFGVQPPTPEWGTMMNEGKDFILLEPNMIFWPGLCIFLVVLNFNFVGDALRDALDPRLSKQLR
jgi:peptide/nickel transport system permease protein